MNLILLLLKVHGVIIIFSHNSPTPGIKREQKPAKTVFPVISPVVILLAALKQENKIIIINKIGINFFTEITSSIKGRILA